ncbi:MAG: GntR family transcriptional regulator [Alicyclobacillus herbarius]|uniref:GntR family transcriptional regulator n=1 Tax=Alicyclobacillus herbarius TaxID=122960 RepID=UPI000418BE7F|nr:GntR family transcriptional regulator [Alicyclobacillus herbarius]MCL6631011.1 GntR family transcriptional regulator [Alicyclobacillus herbarius]
MWLRVDARSSVPMYQQIVDQVKARVAQGLLRPGDRLPSVRDLAGMLAINHNTIAKAYQELERQRVIEVVRGRGTFIAAVGIAPDAAERRQALRDSMRKWVIEAHHLGMGEQELLELFQRVLKDWRTQREGKP